MPDSITIKPALSNFDAFSYALVDKDSVGFAFDEFVGYLLHVGYTLDGSDGYAMVHGHDYRVVVLLHDFS